MYYFHLCVFVVLVLSIVALVAIVYSLFLSLVGLCVCIILLLAVVACLGRALRAPRARRGGSVLPKRVTPPSYIILRVGCSQKSQKFIWACRLAIIEAVPRCTMKKQN